MGAMNSYFILGFILLIHAILWFALSLFKKRNDVADVAWGLGFVVLAWASFCLSEISEIRKIIVCILVSVWGVRLAWHIHNRNKDKPEDYRYKKWREEWGRWFYWRSFVQVYLFQSALLFCVVTPVLAINLNEGEVLGWLDYCGVMVWVFGFYFEVVGDAQLANFVKNPQNKGRIIQSGLWAYTRHPNYFGEVTQWWGIWLMALSVDTGVFTVVGPLTITFLILKVSGIPLLEKKMSKNPEFLEYKKRTSAFFPLPKRKSMRSL